MTLEGASFLFQLSSSETHCVLFHADSVKHWLPADGKSLGLSVSFKIRVKVSIKIIWNLNTTGMVREQQEEQEGGWKERHTHWAAAIGSAHMCAILARYTSPWTPILSCR